MTFRRAGAAAVLLAALAVTARTTCTVYNLVDEGLTQEEWLRPDLVEIFPGLVASGVREVLVVPVQFLADHLEVLYDLDVAAAQQARAAGLGYHRIAMPNSDPHFIRALADVARVTEASLLHSVS